MARRNKMRRPSRRVPRPLSIVSTPDPIVTITGKFLLPFSIGTANVNSPLPVSIATLGSRLSTFSSLYQQFRFTKMKLVLHPGNIANVNTSYVLCYFKDVDVNTAPANFANAYQAPVSRYHDADETVPCSMTLNRSMLLHNTRPWFNTIGTSTITSDFTQGVFFLVLNSAPATAFSANIELVYSVQFRGATNPTVQ